MATNLHKPATRPYPIESRSNEELAAILGTLRRCKDTLEAAMLQVAYRDELPTAQSWLDEDEHNVEIEMLARGIEFDDVSALEV